MCWHWDWDPVRRQILFNSTAVAIVGAACVTHYVPHLHRFWQTRLVSAENLRLTATVISVLVSLLKSS